MPASTLLCLAFTSACADTIHDIGNSTFQHHDSGWIFPERVGEFVRIGAPQDVDGTVDVVAHYARQTNEGRTTAIVDVYPPGSSAPQARHGDALSAMQTELHSSVLPQRAETRIKTSVPLLSTRTLLETSASGYGVLYFIDTGAWIVKIRVHSDRKSESIVAASDAFVQQQRWDSLTLTPETCTGPACAPTATQRDMQKEP